MHFESAATRNAGFKQSDALVSLLHFAFYILH
jgi:hypothetical protein